MAKLKPWYQVVTPREDLRDGRPLDASEFAVHLDHIRTGRGSVSKDYTDPARFFERTYLTGSLLELSSQVARRLNGIQLETSAVFNMATQFGGGKTHSLTTLFHLAQHGDAAKNWKGVSSILLKAQVDSIPKAKTAVFVGTEFDVITGRKGDGEPTRKTPWGEIAWQLGGPEAFAKVAQHDAQGVSPAGDVIRDMLPTGPTLILMDELLNYISSGRKLGMRDQFFNFLQNMFEEARARTNLVLCVSIPRSDLEMNPDDQRDHDSIKKLCDRTGKAILMSADKEMSEIIRRRLFEWDGLTADAKATCSAYAEWAADHAQELAGVNRDAIHEQFRACYPFHPSVVSVFERKWQSLPRFQRTRGVLRLLALWVAHNFQDEHRNNSKEPLITLGLAPLESPLFRAALFEQLGSSELEIPVTADIAGKANESHSLKLDKEASEAIQKAQLHRKVATTIFFESNGGQSQSQAEASLPEIKTDVCGPDINTADVDTVLEGLAGAAGCLVEVYLQRLGSSGGLDEVVDSVPARKLPTYWPASMAEWSTKGVRDAFYSSPLLPRLINPDVVKRAIADGVTQGIFGYAIKDASGRLKLEKMKESLFDADVEISDDVYILKAEEAQKLKEPPRLAQLLVRPEHTTIKIGEQAALTCSGIDQYGLRRKEVASLNRRSFDLKSAQPTVTVEAESSKHRKKDVLPLHHDLVSRIPTWFAHLSLDEPLFPKLKNRRTWLMVKRDLERAGIPYETPEGIADFHAAGRHSYITGLMTNGASLPEAKELARHSDVKQTMKYTHIGMKEQAAALKNLPYQERIGSASAGSGSPPASPAGTKKRKNKQSKETTNPAGVRGYVVLCRPLALNGLEGHFSVQEWRRRELNPRPVMLGNEPLRA